MYRESVIISYQGIQCAESRHQLHCAHMLVALTVSSKPLDQTPLPRHRIANLSQCSLCDSSINSSELFLVVSIGNNILIIQKWRTKKRYIILRSINNNSYLNLAIQICIALLVQCGYSVHCSIFILCLYLYKYRILNKLHFREKANTST